MESLTRRSGLHHPFEAAYLVEFELHESPVPRMQHPSGHQHDKPDRDEATDAGDMRRDGAHDGR